MRAGFFSIIIFLATAGFQSYVNLNCILGQTKSVSVSKTPPKQKIVKTKPIPKTQIPMPAVKEFGVYPFRRDSDNPDSSGIDQAPFNYVEVVNVFFNIEPKKGEKVTVIPLQADYDSFEIEITKVTKSDFVDCNAEPPGTTWEIDFEKVTRKEFLEIKPPHNRNPEFPFDVFIIYPTVKFARRLKPAALKKNMLPKGIYINTVTAAIDLTGDGQPDLLEASYCCNDPKLSAEKCDYTCGMIYKKIKGVWKEAEYISSCT